MSATKVELAGPSIPAALNSEIWQSFVRQHFEHSVTVLPRFDKEAVVPAPVLFSAITRAADLFRAGDTSVEISFWVNGRENKDFVQYLPQALDGSLYGYIDRLERLLAGAEYTFLMADAHLYSDELWGRVRMLLRGLYEHAGIPCGGVDTAVFLGRYRRTPFGVHRGQMSVITLPVHGEKRFRVWERGFGEAHPEVEGRVDYEEFMAGSSQLAGGPGDVLYWPADIWHIAEASETFTATVNVGLWWDRPPLARVLMQTGEQLSELIDESDARGVTFQNTRMPNTLGDCVAPNIRWALDNTRQIINGQELERRLALDGLRMLSADGFRDVPGCADRPPLEPGTLVQRKPHCTVLFIAEANGDLHIAANGCVHTVPEMEEHLEILGQLLEGSPIKVPGDAELTSQLVNWMYSIRAIEEVSANG